MRNSFAVFLLLSVLPAFAQTKHPFTFEDMMALKRVEEPVVSPDGKWVLFAAVDVDLKANTRTPHVWVVPLSEPNNSASVGMTGGQKEIISDQDADRPRWAPDGKRFAFVSTKENGSQIWIANFDGATGTVTAKHRLTNMPTEADGELWSPDGKYILFKSDVYPECTGTAAEEAACNAKRVEEAKDSKVKALIFTHLLYRHWNAYKEGKRTHLFVVPVDGNGRVATGASPVGSSEARQGSESSNKADESAGPTRDSLARDLTPGDYDAPVFSLGGQDDYAFSPNGKELCYASNHDAMPAASTNNDLFTVPVDWPADATSAQVLAATKNITADNKAADNTQLYSPDGKYIAYRAQQRPGYESDRWRLMLYDRKTGEKKNLTEKFDRWVGTIAWAANNGVLFSAESGGEAPIFYVSTFNLANQSFEPTKIVGGLNDDLFPGGGGLLFTRMSIWKPSEIYRARLVFGVGCADPAPGTVRHVCGNCTSDVGLDSSQEEQPVQISHLNDSVLSQVSMSSLEPFWFTGAHNDKVEGFLIKPPNFDPNKKYPVKFLIHGGPEGAWGDDWSYRWNPELFATPTASTPSGYVVIMINFHGSTGYGQKFIDAINGDWGGAPFEDLMKGLDYAEQHYPFIDKNRECALGASYGGYMANWLLGHTHRFKCIVTHDGMFDTESF